MVLCLAFSEHFQLGKISNFKLVQMVVQFIHVSSYYSSLAVSNRVPYGQCIISHYKAMVNAQKD